MRHAIVLSLFTAVTLGAMPRLAHGQAEISLARRYETGQRFSITWNSTARIRETQTLFGVMPSPGFTEESGKVEVRVIDARDGQFRTLEMLFAKCEVRSQQPGGHGAVSQRLPLSGRKVRIERRFDQDFNEERFEVTAEGTVLTPELEDSLKSLFAGGCMPDKPVADGARWESDKVSIFCGPNATGQMQMHLARVEPGENGRRRAVVQVQGQARQDLAARMAAGANGQAAPNGATADLVVHNDFTGTLRVSPDGGLIESIELNGPMRLEHGGSVGQPIIQSGEWSYTFRAAAMEPQQPKVAQKPAPADNPLGEPDALNGTYADDRLTVELRGADGRFAGTITLADQQFPLQARAADPNTLHGTFESRGRNFDFNATAQGDTLTFVTGGKTYTLRKQLPEADQQEAANPLGEAVP